MRKTIAAALAAVMVMAAVGAIAATKQKDDAARCVTHKSATTLVANADARVYSVFKGYAKHANAYRTAVYACRYKTGRTIKLGTAWQTADENLPNDRLRFLRNIVLSRNVADTPPGVAFVDSNCLGHPCQFTVVVRSLGSGDVVYRVDAGSAFDELSLGVGKGGRLTLAWLEESPGGTCDDGCRIHLLKHKGDEVLDEGTDIDPSYFGALDSARRGVPCCGDGANVFVWKRGDALKSASFD
jgi:hypothetical protein